MRPFRKILLFLLCFAGFLGCALAPVKETLTAPEDRFARDSIARAKEFEAAGQLPEALRQYKIALTVWPNDLMAKEGRERVEMTLRKGAQEHYRLGLRMQKEGKQAQALQHYLTALRLWPDYPEALRMTVARRPVPAEKQVVQKVQPEPEIQEPPERLATEEEAPVLFEIPTVQEEPQEVVQQIAEYREHGTELYLEGRYHEALSEFNKVLSA